MSKLKSPILLNVKSIDCLKLLGCNTLRNNNSIPPHLIEFLYNYSSHTRLSCPIVSQVTENLSVVAYIKDRFNIINFVDGDACASVVPSPFESLDEQTNFTTYMLEAENHGAIHDIKPPVSTFDQFGIIQDVLTVSRRIRPETLHCEKEHKGDMQGINM